MFKLKKQNYLFIGISIALIIFPTWGYYNLRTEIKNAKLNNSEEPILGASGFFAQNASIQANLEILGTYASVSGNLAFYGEIMPDGSTCGANEILKRTGANNWDCATDAGGSVTSNSLDFDEFVASMSLDTFTDVTFGAQQLSLNLDSTGDFLIQDAGTTFFSANDSGLVTITNASISERFELTSSTARLGINAGNNTDVALEVGGTASIGNTLYFATNSDLCFDGSTCNVKIVYETGALGFQISNTVVGSLINLTDNASASSNFEVVGSASFNSIRGAGLTECDAETQTLNWDLTSGKFSCLTDGTGGGGGTQIEFREGSTDLGNISSISFDPPHFVLSFSGVTGTVKLDWGAGGPASLSEAETISGNWVNTANPWADNEVIDALTVNWTGLDTYPTGCTNQFVTTIGDTLTCASVDISAMTNLTAGTDLTLTNDDLTLDSTLTQAFSFTNTGSQTFTGSVDVSKGLHALAALTVTSSSSFNGGVRGSGLVDCDAATDTLNWDITSGKFSCGTDDDIPEVGDFGALVGGSGIDNNSGTLDFDATELSGLTWSAGGSATFAHTFDLSGIDPILTFRTGTFDFTGGASFSQGVEFATYASVSQRFQLPLNGTLSANRDITVDPDGPGQLIFYATGSEQVLTDEHYITLSIGSSSFNAFTSRSLGEQLRGITVERIWCKAQNATSVVINLTDETNNDMDQITCNTTGVYDDGTIANATLTKGEELYLERRTISGEVDYLPITIRFRYTRE